MQAEAMPPVAAMTATTQLDFERIHAQYRPAIRRYLTRLVGTSDAEDLTQAVFVKVSQGLPDFRGESSLSTWIFRIARHAATDWRRHTSRTRAIHQELADGARGAEIGTEAPAVEDALIHREMRQCIRRVVDRLPDSYRAVLTLSELEGLPNAAIAHELGVTVPTVKVRLHRARGHLREAFTECCVLTRDARGGVGCERKGEW